MTEELTKEEQDLAKLCAVHLFHHEIGFSRREGFLARYKHWFPTEGTKIDQAFEKLEKKLLEQYLDVFHQSSKETQYKAIKTGFHPKKFD